MFDKFDFFFFTIVAILIFSGIKELLDFYYKT